MAATTAGTRLTEAHRLAQARLAAGIVRRFLVSWGLIDPENIDRSAAQWIELVTPLIEAQIQTSARLAANYLTAFRAIELGAGTYAPTLAAGSPAEAIQASLLTTGPNELKRLIGKGVPLDQAIDKARTRSAAAATRHALSGGRATIVATVAGDPQAVGYARVTSAKPCYFCAMLAGRGHVYKTAMSAGFKPHDACHCEPEPAYRLDTPLPPAAQRFKDLWGEATKGYSGQDKVNAFRRAYEAQQRTAAAAAA